MITLQSEITKISKVGEQTAKRLKLLDIKTAEDLLFYFPFRYDDFQVKRAIKDLKAKESANIVGRVELIQNRRSARKRMNITEALVSDEGGSIKVVWFNQPFIVNALRIGDEVSLSGKIDEDFSGFVMRSPAYERYSGNLAHTQGIVPNYHLTANVTQKQLRFLIKQVIGLASEIPDWLPEETVKSAGLMAFGEAVQQMHFPDNWARLKKARQKLAFNELFIVQIKSLALKDFQKQSVAVPVPMDVKLVKRFVDSLPFKLTDAQRKAAWEIMKDMEDDKPMARLLVGDVGSGKTIVAVMAALSAIGNLESGIGNLENGNDKSGIGDNQINSKKTQNQKLSTGLAGDTVLPNSKFQIPNSSRQAAIMVPTEILARQHFLGIKKLFAKFDIKAALFTQSEKMFEADKISRKKMIDMIKFGEIGLVIGTHALIQEKIEFKNLVLAVIDEQHRFGVAQRRTLTAKSGDARTVPHLLSMTATPIPRSLALALYGDLEYSLINEMPKGRKKIITKVVAEENRDKAYDFIRQKIGEGRQAFVVCPLIDESDKLGVTSVKQEFDKLDKEVFPDIEIAMLHGRMKSEEKERIMRRFILNEIKILVSTSVIEVGIDVPNATIMMIEGADRFGLSQLHQFRGRVGRGEHQSYCFLFTESQSNKTMDRLQALAEHNDGFELAKIDLKYRGPGDVYGTDQKGYPEFKIADLFDYALIKKSREEAEKIFIADPNFEKWPELKMKIEEIKESVHRE